MRPEAWDALRTRTDGDFALPSDRTAWEAVATSRPDLARRAQAIDAWLTAQSAGSVGSYGVGGGSLEYLMWRGAPQRRLVVSDYAPGTVARLAAVFPEAEVRRFDLLAEDPLDVDVHLFHRIDTELDNRAWRRVFARFGHSRILVVATEVISARRASWELRTHLRNRRATRAGWVRNRAAFERLWARTHTGTPLRVHDLHAWDLRPRG